MRYLFLLFITVPIVEMWILIEVGSRIGVISTIALVFMTAAIGLGLLRQQGLDTLLRVNQKMEQGQLPAQEVLTGLMLAIGGALLLTPGFVTDIVGFVCLLPPTRKLLVTALLRRGVFMANQKGAGMDFGTTFEHSMGAEFLVKDPLGETSHSSRSTSARLSGDVLDGEYRRED